MYVTQSTNSHHLKQLSAVVSGHEVKVVQNYCAFFTCLFLHAKEKKKSMDIHILGVKKVNTVKT